MDKETNNKSTPEVTPTQKNETTETSNATQTGVRRRIRRRRVHKGSSQNSNQEIPSSITENKDLQKAVSSLPFDYDFEIYKTVWRIQSFKYKNIALQMPEGLLLYACTISDILRNFCPSLKSVTIMGDVTYGACCVDDLGAHALGSDLLVHYGHSCLVSNNKTVIPCLYIFVEIRIDVQHLVDCVCETLPEETHIAVMGTVQVSLLDSLFFLQFFHNIIISLNLTNLCCTLLNLTLFQFRAAVTQATKLLNERNRPSHIPQAKPLSKGEVLGCTAPTICDSEDGANKTLAMLFIADGRFHLEAAMIANPQLKAYRYDPYGKKLTIEEYENDKMKSIRKKAIHTASSALKAKQRDTTFGIILGTLGRQGNPALVSQVQQILSERKVKFFVILLSEVFPQKLEQFQDKIDVWVQIACPRLSVDWGHFFKKPVLTVYELQVMLSQTEWREVYPMDFYAMGSGKWSNYHEENKGREMKVLF